MFAIKSAGGLKITEWGVKMFCPKCGAQVNDGLKFCSNCGTAVNAAPADNAQPTARGTVAYKNIKDNPNLSLLGSAGCFSVYEHRRDMSSEYSVAQIQYFMQQMNIRKRQVLAELNGNSIKMQAGAMQWIAGNVNSETGLGTGAKAVGKFMKGLIKGAVSGESAVKPIYTGTGAVMLEPTYKYILFENPAAWGPAGIVLQDSLFLACDAHLQEKIVSRKNFSSLFAGEGLFNLSILGEGTLVLESPVPREELFEFDLNEGVLKIDGNMAIAWSGSLELTVERSSASLVGSLVNKEGLVNVYRGTGKVLMAPTVPGTLMEGGEAPDKSSEGGSASKGFLSGIAKLATE